jgi:hypothetical protein
MAWTTPMTAVPQIIFAAAMWNTHVRNNFLELMPAKATDISRIFATSGLNTIAERVPTGSTVATSQTTTSASYTDLATGGPAVTVTTGTKAFIFLYTHSSNNTANNFVAMSFAISGATTLAAADGRSIVHSPPTNGRGKRGSSVFFIDTLTAGSNTFTAKYRVGGGTGAWQDRRLAVLPL